MQALQCTRKPHRSGLGRLGSGRENWRQIPAGESPALQFLLYIPRESFAKCSEKKPWCLSYIAWGEKGDFSLGLIPTRTLQGPKAPAAGGEHGLQVLG